MPKKNETDTPSDDGASQDTTQAKKQLSQRILPAYPLEKALLIARAIVDQFGGKSGDPTSIALAIKWAPTGGSWRMLCGSSIAYGLTEGGYNANEIGLTRLGAAIVKPQEEGTERAALLKALVQPSAIKSFVEKYNKNKYPTKPIAVNVLETMGVPRDRGPAAYDLLTENFKYLGVLVDTKNGQLLHIDAVATTAPLVATNGAATGEATPPLTAPERSTAARPTAKKQFFIAHGSDSEALAQLKNMLNELHIPFVVAVDEPHGGRPISEKVAQLMRESSGGLYIFSADETVTTRDGKTEKRPRLNIVFELGAGSLLYGKRIVIFKEEGVVFPSDFSDLGYIGYEKGQLKNKSLDLLKELMKLGAVQVLPEA